MATSDIFNLTDTWNAGATTFTAIKMNVTDTASASGSLLMNLQVGGSSRASINKNGVLVLNAVGGVYAVGNSTTVGAGSSFIENFGVTTTQVGLPSSIPFGWSSTASPASTLDVILTRAAAASLQLGASDAAAPVAQTLGVQSVVAGTTNTAGTNFTIKGSAGTGTGAGGSIIFQVAPAGSSGTAQNALVNALQVLSSGVVQVGSSTAFQNFIGLGTPSINVGSGAAINSSASFAGEQINLFSTGTNVASINTSGIRLASTYSIGWGNGASTGGTDTFLVRDAANTLALRNGTAAQAFNVYNTFTSSTDFERLRIFAQSGSSVIIGTEKGSGGGTARNLELQRDSTAQITLGNGETFIGAGGQPLITLGHSSTNTSARIGFNGGVQFVNSTIAGVTALRITNGALGDVGGIQFGGTTSSFPALKRNSTALETKLADDSAYAPHAMQYLDVTDGITAPASATGRARIYVDTADGDLKVIFADGTVKTIVTDT